MPVSLVALLCAIGIEIEKENPGLGITRRIFLARGGIATMALAASRSMAYAMAHPTIVRERTQPLQRRLPPAKRWKGDT